MHDLKGGDGFARHPSNKTKRVVVASIPWQTTYKYCIKLEKSSPRPFRVEGVKKSLTSYLDTMEWNNWQTLLVGKPIVSSVLTLRLWVVAFFLLNKLTLLRPLRIAKKTFPFKCNGFAQAPGWIMIIHQPSKSLKSGDTPRNLTPKRHLTWWWRQFFRHHQIDSIKIPLFHCRPWTLWT